MDLWFNLHDEIMSLADFCASESPHSKTLNFNGESWVAVELSLLTFLSLCCLVSSFLERGDWSLRVENAFVRDEC